MRTSEKIGALVAALATAKASIKAPKKGRTANVGKYSYNYADRADVIEAYQKPLLDNNLQVIHSVQYEDNITFLVSRLAHASGEWIESRIPIPQVGEAQILGSWLSYLERYQSCALLDVAAQDDDDGARAVVPKREQETEPDPTSLPFFDLRVAIQDAAAELEQRGGGMGSDHIKRAAEFKGRDGNMVSFSDPFARNVTEKWAKGVLRKLQDQLIDGEPGVKEAAAVLA